MASTRKATRIRRTNKKLKLAKVRSKKTRAKDRKNARTGLKLK